MKKTNTHTRAIKPLFTEKKKLMKFIFILANVIALAIYAIFTEPFYDFHAFVAFFIAYVDFLFKSSIVYFLAVMSDAIVLRKKKSTVKKTEKKEIKPQENTEQQEQTDPFDQGAV